jgi:2-polyprenyl-3-methyl-5-hydroxy-6-metoxy-1,4-benzoquinol methylase
MEIIEQCPVCGKADFTDFLKGTDFFLTKEKFVIVQCNNCGLKFVNPRPGEIEINKYYESPEYISHDTDKPGILTSIYSLARKYTINKKFCLVDRNSQGKNILDYGCGTGEFILYCKKKGWNVTGIEPNKKPREFAVERHGLKVINTSELKDLQDTSFNVITLWHVLEHIHRLEEVFGTLSKLLAKNGTLIIAVPNSNSLDAMHYGEYWAAYDLPRHLYHFSKSTMERLAIEQGFRIEKILPMKLDSFYISLLSEKYKNGHARWFSAFLNGEKSNRFAKKNGMEYSSLIFVLKLEKKEK